MSGQSSLESATVELLSRALERLQPTDDCLVQLWAAGADGELTTRGIPFANLSSTRGGGDALAAFRVGSLPLHFSPGCGAPGRVFASGCAELSPNVLLYSEVEYYRRELARDCGVVATLFTPVWRAADSASSSAVAVLELACTGQKAGWAPLIDRIERELAASGLRMNACTQRSDVVAAARAAGALP